MKRFRPRLTYANVIASLALFVALGGSAVAAGLAKNSVGPNQLKQGAVTAGKIRKQAVTSGKIAPKAVDRGQARPERGAARATSAPGSSRPTRSPPRR